MPKPAGLDQLPSAYKLLAEIVEHANAIRFSAAEHDRGAEIVELAASVVHELFLAGQTERRAINAYEHDQPLWCGGLHVDVVYRLVGVAPPGPPARRMEFGPRDSRPADNYNLARSTDET